MRTNTISRSADRPRRGFERLASFSLKGVFAGSSFIQAHERSAIDAFRPIQGLVPKALHVSFLRQSPIAPFRPLTTQMLRPSTPYCWALWRM